MSTWMNTWLIVEEFMRHFTICYYCKYCKRVDINKTVDCEKLGKVTAALHCKYFEASGSEQQK